MKIIEISDCSICPYYSSKVHGDNGRDYCADTHKYFLRTVPIPDWCLLEEQPLQEVYEKYKHLDTVLSDERWLDGSDFKYHIMADLWRAVREIFKEKP